ncbi:MAG TPA: FAD-binding protein [Gemmatimonadaceae bacterium]|nr:FAD-binding protein [Gemmatimonadaceae bacterium]
MTAAPLSAEAAAVQDRVRSAAASRTPLRLAGRGAWLDAGRPVRAAERLSLAETAGIVDYVPGDLTMTVRAGTTLGEIAAAAGAEGQWLALDPPGRDDGTIGATAATASAGPLAHGFGLPRDNVLGLEFVDGTGAVVRGGGRVVKNVAGFDLTRLLVGSWGTLGAITEVTVRLRALPARELTLALALPDPSERGGAPLRDTLAALRAAPLAAWALEAVNPELAASLGLGDAPVALARVGGNEELVRAQHDALRAIGGDVREVDSSVWARLRACEPERAIVLRYSWPPAQLAENCARLFAHRPREASDAPPAPLMHASLGRGVLRCIVPLPDSPADARRRLLLPRLIPDASGTRIFERLPGPLWTELGIPPAAGDRLSRGIKAKFDPAGVLNPGILGE